MTESNEVEVDLRFNPEEVIPSRHVTVVENVYYHRGHLEQPEHFSRVYSTQTSSEIEDGCYTRRVNLEEDKVHKMDFGWVEDPLFVLIHNHAGENPQTIPSPQEKAEIDKRIVSVSFGTIWKDSALQILPGTDNRFTPETSEILLCCSSGSTRVTYTIVPR